MLESIGRSVVQILTGRLLAEAQIEKISASVVGRLLSDWLPEPKNEREAHGRVDAARTHITEATRLVTELKADLDKQIAELQALAVEVEAKKRQAEDYTALASANESTVRALKGQLEAVVRRELEEQASKGRRVRQTVALLVWFVTLVGGSAVGAHWREIESAIRAWMGS